jgi:hypothetical protein
MLIHGDVCFEKTPFESLCVQKHDREMAALRYKRKKR